MRQFMFCFVCFKYRLILLVSNVPSPIFCKQIDGQTDTAIQDSFKCPILFYNQFAMFQSSTLQNKTPTNKSL